MLLRIAAEYSQDRTTLRSDKCWHDTDSIRARHFCAKMPSRLMSIGMIVFVVAGHEYACVHARVVRCRACHTRFDQRDAVSGQRAPLAVS